MVCLPTPIVSLQRLHSSSVDRLQTYTVSMSMVVFVLAYAIYFNDLRNIRCQITDLKYLRIK